MPKRIQRKRTKGFKLPAGTVCCTRPGLFGNPFGGTEAVRLHREWLKRNTALSAIVRGEIARKLSGAKFLACWCSLEKPCHVDNIIDLLNGKL